MPANSAEYQRRYRSLRKNERKEEISMLLKFQEEIEFLRKEVAFLRKEMGSPDGSLRRKGSLDSPKEESPSLTLPGINGHAIARPAFAAEFDEWWKAYPHKVGKIAALKAFQKARRAGLTLERLIDGVRTYANKTDDRPWCNPATWLNQGRWDDDEQQSHGNGHTTVSGPSPPTAPAPTLRELGLEG